MAADIIARGLALGMSGDVEDVKEKIGKIEEELEGKESLILASTKQEMEALCTAENEGKYVKYVGGPLTIEHGLQQEASYTYDFNSTKFITKIEDAEFKKDIVYNGTAWVNEGETYNLSEYGVTLYKGTPNIMPPLGTIAQIQFDTTHMPTVEEIDAAISAGGKLFTALNGPIEMSITFTTETYQARQGHWIMCHLKINGSDYLNEPLFGISDGEAGWDSYLVTILPMYAQYKLLYTEVNNDVYSICQDYISPYSFPHVPYVPEAELSKTIGDTVSLSNVLVNGTYPQVGPFDGSFYVKCNDDTINYLKVLPYSMHEEIDDSAHESVIILTGNYENAPEEVYFMSVRHNTNSSLDDLSNYQFYYGQYRTDYKSVTATTVGFTNLQEYYYDQVVGLYKEASERYCPTALTEVNVADKSVLLNFVSSTTVVGIGVKQAAMELSFAPRIDIVVDTDKLLTKVGTHPQDITFIYHDNEWIGGGINTSPLTESDIGTDIHDLYFNTLANNNEITSLICNTIPSGTLTALEASEHGIKLVNIPDLNIQGILTSADDQIYATRNFTEGSLTLIQGWNNVDANGKCGFIFGTISSIAEKAESLLTKLVSKAPFEYPEIDLSEYGVTVTGAPEDGMAIVITIQDVDYDTNRTYTVSVEQGNYSYVPTYVAPGDRVQVTYNNAAGEEQGMLKFVKCTKAEYDALVKDVNTLYFITD